MISFPPVCTEWRAFLCHDPLPIGGVAVALIVGTTALLGIPVDLPLLGMAFCGTALVYGTDRTLGLSPEDALNRPDRVRWVRQHQRWLRGEAIGLAMVAVSLIPLLQWETLVLIFLLGGVAFLHVVPLLPGGRRLKASGGLKPILIAVTWAVGAVLVPAIESGVGLSASVLWLAAYRFLFLLPNVLLADWVDRQGDAAVGLQPWTMRCSFQSLRLGMSVCLGICVVGATTASLIFEGFQLLVVDAGGGLLMAIAVWQLPSEVSPLHVCLFDLLVAWPLLDGIVLNMGLLS